MRSLFLMDTNTLTARANVYPRPLPQRLVDPILKGRYRNVARAALRRTGTDTNREALWAVALDLPSQR